MTLNVWWEQAFEYRSGGFDRLLGGFSGCPNIESLTRDAVAGSLFVHELTEVRPGTALDYLAAVREERAPLLADYGHPLVGLYEVMMNDYEVCTIWATDRRRRTCARPRPATSPAASRDRPTRPATRGSRRGTPGPGPGR